MAPELALGSDELDALKQRVTKVVDDGTLNAELEAEGVDDAGLKRAIDALFQEQERELARTLAPAYREWQRQGKRVTRYFEPTRGSGAVEWLGGLFGLYFFGGVVGLIVIPVAKWTGHLVSWSFRPWIGAVVLGLVMEGAVTWFDEALQGRARRKRDVEDAPIAQQRAETELDQNLHVHVVSQALRRAATPTFRDPAEEEVQVTEGRSLAARIDARARIETRSFRQVLAHLKRSGGSTVGLAGSRGAGKSELLRRFCEDPGSASQEGGGTLGVVIPVPVATEAQPFLRLVIRELCQKVPGYDKADGAAPRLLHSWRFPAVVGVISCLAGAALIADLRTSITQQRAGWALVVLGAVALYVSGVASMLSRWRLRRRPLTLGYRSKQEQAKVARATREIERLRLQVAQRAASTARRIRYVETRTTSGEASASWRGIGGKRTSTLSLNQLPLTETELLAELSMLVSDLKGVGYDVVIGIDELDKLEGDECAQAFLNGVKGLFPIRDCSFLITVSDSAWARFARRGVALRDVFDSSLDTVVVVKPLTFGEARTLVRKRGESLSDTQVLFCHCLSGGLPRDLLRFGRLLGEKNYDQGGRATLAAVISAVLTYELDAKLDGTVLALRSVDQTIEVQRLVARLDSLRRAEQNQWHERLEEFLAHDEPFSQLADPDTHPGVQDTDLDRPQPPADGQPDTRWIATAWRELHAYLNLLDAMRAAFAAGGPVSRLASATGASAQALLDGFEQLAGARRRLEIDVAAGWRQVIVARRALGLPVPSQPLRVVTETRAQGA